MAYRIVILFYLAILSSCVRHTEFDPLVVRLDSLKLEEQLEPTKIRFVTEDYYLENLTTRLISLDKQGNYQGQLAEKIIVSKDKKELVFLLKNARYSDGRPISATDVARSLKRSILKSTNHTNPLVLFKNAEKLRSIEDNFPGVEAIGDLKIIIRLKQPVKEIFYYLSLPDYAILTPVQYSKIEDLVARDWLEVTSGPYRLALDGPSNQIIFALNKSSLEYSPKLAEKIVPFGYGKAIDLVKLVKSGALHIGELTMSEMRKYYDDLKRLDHIDIFSSGIDGITHLILNAKADAFKNKKARQWVYRKCFEHYQVRGKISEFTQKSYQFFLPDARGFVSVERLRNIVNEFPSGEAPAELKNGFVIQSIASMRDYLPENFAEELSSILGIPVSVDFGVRGSYDKFLQERKFAAHVMATSMSYKVLSESINLQYSSSPPTLTDPTGNIKKLLIKYQSTDSEQLESSYINEIIFAMARDAESIPLFYFKSPLFVNSSKVDSSKIDFSESFKFWQLSIKK